MNGPIVIKPRAAVDADVWNYFVAQHSSGWLWHTSHWIDYCCAYTVGACDRSFVAMSEGGTVLGVCPLIASADEFAMGGDPCAWPLAITDQAEGAIMTHIDALASEHNIRRARFRSSPLAADPTLGPLWKGWTNASFESQVVKIDRDLALLWNDVRDGHRAEIHRGLREFSIERIESSFGLYAFHALHVTANSRETRSPATWENNLAMWVEGMVDVFLARRDGVDVGGAMFFRYKDGIYFASAAWPEPHVAHAVVWTAIRHYRGIVSGLTELEMGWLNTGSLAVFKRGFGGETRKVIVRERRWR